MIYGKIEQKNCPIEIVFKRDGAVQSPVFIQL